MVMLQCRAFEMFNRFSFVKYVDQWNCACVFVFSLCHLQENDESIDRYCNPSLCDVMSSVYIISLIMSYSAQTSFCYPDLLMQTKRNIDFIQMRVLQIMVIVRKRVILFLHVSKSRYCQLMSSSVHFPITFSEL